MEAWDLNAYGINNVLEFSAYTKTWFIRAYLNDNFDILVKFTWHRPFIMLYKDSTQTYFQVVYYSVMKSYPSVLSNRRTVVVRHKSVQCRTVAHTRGIHKLLSTRNNCSTFKWFQNPKLTTYYVLFLPSFEEVWLSVLGSKFSNYSNGGMKGWIVIFCWQYRLFNLKWVLKKLGSLHGFVLCLSAMLIMPLELLRFWNTVVWPLNSRTCGYADMKFKIVKDGNFLQLLTWLTNVIFEWL